MKSTLAASILFIASTTSAAPLPFGTPDQPTYYYPASNSIYNQADGSVDFDSDHGAIFRTVSNNPPELSTLVNFYFYEQSAGKTCRFNFELDSEGYKVVHQNGANPEFDVFVSEAAVTNDIPGVPGGAPNNKRGQQLGRMRVVPGGQAEVVWGEFEFACPEPDPATPRSWEVVAVGQEADVEWSKQDGPWIGYY